MLQNGTHWSRQIKIHDSSCRSSIANINNLTGDKLYPITNNSCLLFDAYGWPALAQSSRGTITGTVADPAGAVIPGATIEAKNTATGTVHQADTSPRQGIIVVRIQF
jgi:hypothetical protein